MSAPDPSNVELRVLTRAEDLAALPEFEVRVWGGESPPVSVNMLVAAIIEGGVAIAAYDGDLVVGSAFGFPTREPDVLHSHYMAVDPAYRRSGLAVRLKQHQREWCLANGYTAMRWTFDPLQLTNAHLNLRSLGAVGIAYHPNHYGALGGINGSLPSDRVTVRWDLVGGSPARPEPELAVDVLPATPQDIAESNETAFAARLALREQLAGRLGAGWLLVDVDRESRRYLLARA